MLQNWLKPIKGHNGPVPALNVIPEPGRNRVNKEHFISLRLYASEILSILVQNEPINRRLFAELAPGGTVGGAMDSLLQTLAYYKRHDPATAEEQELMENLFDVLCALLLHTPNR